MIVNPKGVLFDAYQVTNEAGDAPSISLLDWDMKACRVAAWIDRKAGVWTVELAVPFSSFPWQLSPPKGGSVWRAAVTRYDRPDPPSGELQHYAWSPPYRRGWPRCGGQIWETGVLGEGCGLVRGWSRQSGHGVEVKPGFTGVPLPRQ